MELVKVAAFAAVGSWLGGKIAPMVVNKFSPAGGLSESSVMIADLAITGLTTAVLFKFLKV